MTEPAISVPSERPLKVVHFSANGPTGGAGRAGFGIHASLLEAGCDSWMVVGSGMDAGLRLVSGCGEGVADKFRASVVRHQQARMISRLHPKETFFPDTKTTARISGLTLPVVPDIIHVHWIGGYLSSHDILQLWSRYRVPIVWTIMDMSPLTGGCHYSHGCQKFTERCGSCPLIDSSEENDISRKSMLSKLKNLEAVPICMVGATQWPLDLAAKSALFKTARKVKIPYGIAPEVFRPVSRQAAREILDVRQDSQVLFMGSANHADERKGMNYLIEALQHLPTLRTSTAPPLTVLIAGKSHADYGALIPFPCLELGSLNDDRALALAYQAADIFVCPSVEDSGPLMIPESLMCGTPVVAFDSCGGVPDFLEEGVNACIAKSRDAQDLARAMQKALTTIACDETIQATCRDGALPHFSPAAQAARYIAVYRELLSGGVS